MLDSAPSHAFSVPQSGSTVLSKQLRTTAEQACLGRFDIAPTNETRVTMRPVDGARQIVTRRRSRHAELHWIPRAGQDTPRNSSAHQEYAVIDRELDERDWAAIDPLRVRTSKGIRHRCTPAMHLWQRTRSHVWCESQEERWEVLWLDYGGQVDRLWAQPGAITFGHGSRLSGHWC